MGTILDGFGPEFHLFRRNNLAANSGFPGLHRVVVVVWYFPIIIELQVV